MSPHGRHGPRLRRLALPILALLGLSAATSAGGGAQEAAWNGDARAGVVGDSTPGTVILLHGLGRTHRSMGALREALEKAGYRSVNLAYPSRHDHIPALADTLAAEINRCCASGSQPLHFVTHSLGGILVRAYQARHGGDRIGRVVMLSPPNHGSEVVDRIPAGLLRLLMGPAVLQLSTDSTSLLRDLPPVDFELGIITGDATLNPLFSWWLPGEDDGKVTVESARISGAGDFLVVPYSHTWIMRREQVIEEVLHFLDAGRFSDSPEDGASTPLS